MANKPCDQVIEAADKALAAQDQQIKALQTQNEALTAASSSQKVPNGVAFGLAGLGLGALVANVPGALIGGLAGLIVSLF